MYTWVGFVLPLVALALIAGGTSIGEVQRWRVFEFLKLVCWVAALIVVILLTYRGIDAFRVNGIGYALVIVAAIAAAFGAIYIGGTLGDRFATWHTRRALFPPPR